MGFFQYWQVNGYMYLAWLAMCSCASVILFFSCSRRPLQGNFSFDFSSTIESHKYENWTPQKGARGAANVPLNLQYLKPGRNKKYGSNEMQGGDQLVWEWWRGKVPNAPLHYLPSNIHMVHTLLMYPLLSSSCLPVLNYSVLCSATVPFVQTCLLYGLHPFF